MFEIIYVIVQNEYDDFIGQNGFFQVKCGTDIYGEIYDDAIKEFVDKVSIYDWFMRLMKVVDSLAIKNYVVLNDVESFNTWIEFRRKENKIEISMVKATKKIGTSDIEFALPKPVNTEWRCSGIDYEQFEIEVKDKAKKYLEEIIMKNEKNKEIRKMQKKYNSIFQKATENN